MKPNLGDAWDAWETANKVLDWAEEESVGECWKAVLFWSNIVAELDHKWEGPLVSCTDCVHSGDGYWSTKCLTKPKWEGNANINKLEKYYRMKVERNNTGQCRLFEKVVRPLTKRERFAKLFDFRFIWR